MKATLTLKEICLSLAVTGANDTFCFSIFGGGMGLVEVTGWIEAGWELETDMLGSQLPYSSCEFKASYLISLNLSFLMWTVGRIIELNYFVRLLLRITGI